MTLSSLAALPALRIAALVDIGLIANETLQGPHHELLPIGGSAVAQLGLLLMAAFVFVELIASVSDLIQKARASTKRTRRRM